LLWLYDIPTMQLAGLFALVFVGVTWLGIVFIHPLFRRLLRNQAEVNNLVGVVLASHCAFFGLLLGLLAVAAYQNLSDIDKSATKEAEYLHAIYRSVSAYPEPMRSKMLPLIREYTRSIIEDAWPMQRRGAVPKADAEQMKTIVAQLYSFEPQTKGQEIYHAQTIELLTELDEAQLERVHNIDAGIPAILWYVVALGTCITIILMWMLDMQLVSHLLLSGLLALFLGAVICLVVAMDRPFLGEISIGPDAYQSVYEEMKDP
jgi:hypothetical protein